jgi:hypothetical protein
MNWVNSILILLAAFVAVFIQATWGWVRELLGAPLDLLPALMVYASLSSDLVTMSLLAVLGGLWFDSLSANPFGITILPLFFAGFIIYSRRGLIVQEQYYARFVLGLGATALVLVLTLLMQLSARHMPLFGWGTLWQWLVMSIGGGLLTPACFGVLGRLNHALTYRPIPENSFRPDREIRRGRN